MVTYLYSTDDNVVGTNSAKENLLDFITNISPKDTPFTSGLKVQHDAYRQVNWLIDVLPARGSKVTIEGEDAVYADVTAPTRAYNYMSQIEVTWQITDVNIATTHAGMADLLSYEIAKQSAVWKNALEYDAIQGTRTDYTETSTGSIMGGAQGWITSNSTALGDNPLDEKALNDLSNDVYDDGGNPTEVYLGGWLKRKISSFSTNVKNVEAADKRLINTVDIYINDFGQLKIMLCRDVTAGYLLLIEPKLWALSYMIDPHKEDRAKTGSATRGVIIGDATLISKQQLGNGMITGASTTA